MKNILPSEIHFFTLSNIEVKFGFTLMYQIASHVKIWYFISSLLKKKKNKQQKLAFCCLISFYSISKLNIAGNSEAVRQRYSVKIVFLRILQ